jgi:hypothetical protein
MRDEPPVPRDAKVLDSAGLLVLENQAADLDLSQRLPRAWLDRHLAPSGKHHLRPLLWHSFSHRPELPRHLRCELLIELADGEQVLSLLDVLPEAYAPLPSVRSRDEFVSMTRTMTQARSVREYSEANGNA